jgi:hypothetical protein
MARLTRLQVDDVDLDSWRKMRVGSAKKIFAPETIRALLHNVIQEQQIDVDCKIFMCNNYNDNIIVDDAWQQRKGQCTPGLLLVLTKKLIEKTAVIPSDLYCAEFMCIIHDIFVDLFLHKDKKITAKNVSSIRAIIGNHLQYFMKWYTNQNQAKESNRKDWVAMFLAKETWQNILTSINGFFYYCEDSIKRNGKNDYIPVLRSNTSTLESLFSNIRGMCGQNETSVANYTAAISKIQMCANSQMLKYNKTYLQEHTEVEKFKPKLELPATKKKKLAVLEKKYPNYGLEGVANDDDRVVPPFPQGPAFDRACNLYGIVCKKFSGRLPLL